jgi:hypothetical protein
VPEDTYAASGGLRKWCVGIACHGWFKLLLELLIDRLRGQNNETADAGLTLACLGNWCEAGVGHFMPRAVRQMARSPAARLHWQLPPVVPVLVRGQHAHWQGLSLPGALPVAHLRLPPAPDPHWHFP